MAINCWKQLGRVISDTKTLRHIWIRELRCWDGTDCDSRGRLHLRVQRYNLWRVENLEFWLRIVVALVLISQLFVPEHATKNQPITYIRLEAVIISQLILLSHIFTIRLTTATCSTNAGIIVECGWKAGWEFPTSPLEMNLARCQIQRDEVLPASVYTTSFPSWEKEDLRWTAEHVSMLATKRPFFS